MTTSFLTLNGITIPTAKTDTGGSISRTLYGERTAGYGGQANLDIRAQKRVWSFNTKPIDPIRAQAIVGLVQGDGLNIPYTSDSYATNGLGLYQYTTVGGTFVGQAADGYNVVDENGVIEALHGVGTTALTTDRGVTNLLTTAQATGSSNTGTTAGSGTLTAADTTHYWTGTTAFKMVGTGSGGDQVRFANTSSVATNAIYVSFSAYVYCPTANISVSCNLATGSGNFINVTGGGPFSIPQNVWKRIFVTAQLIGASSYPGAVSQAILTLNTATNAPFWIDGVQLEMNSLFFTGPTAWQNPASGARLGMNYSYIPNMPVNTGITFSGWFANAYPTPNGQAQVLINLIDNVANTRLFWIEMDYSSSSTLGVSFLTANGANQVGYTMPSYQLTGWTHICASYNPYPPPGGNFMTLWVNGTVVGTPLTSGTLATTTISTVQIANAYNGFPFNGRINDFQVLPYGVDQNWVNGIISNFQAGYQNGPTPLLYASGTSIASAAPVLVYGMIKKETYVGYNHPTYGQINQGRVLEIVLTEV